MAISGATHEKTKMMMRNKDDDQKKTQIQCRVNEYSE